jgi:hypothetical protein
MISDRLMYSNLRGFTNRIGKTRDLNDRTSIEILRKTLSINCCTHEYLLNTLVNAFVLEIYSDLNMVSHECNNLVRASVCVCVQVQLRTRFISISDN